jgi:hypothetical protein
MDIDDNFLSFADLDETSGKVRGPTVKFTLF